MHSALQRPGEYWAQLFEKWKNVLLYAIEIWETETDMCVLMVSLRLLVLPKYDILDCYQSR